MYVPDVKTQRWVIVAPSRKSRPDQGAMHPESRQRAEKGCPFCVGNEQATPPEVYRIGTGESNTVGWQVRVVPNLYPITDTHEVIIHSPDDTKDIEDLPVEQVLRILTAYRDRYRAHDADGQVLIFCNHGFAAGASLKHPHAQLVVIPRQINLDALYREPVANIIEDNTYFYTYCPDFSQWPFEVWIAPKVEGAKFGDIEGDKLSDLAAVLQRALVKIRAAQTSGLVSLVRDKNSFEYNYYIYHGVNWYIRITPRFIHRAGFELGTGLSVNVVEPKEAAQVLKEVTK
mgnify:CR=1 FL=1